MIKDDFTNKEQKGEENMKEIRILENSNNTKVKMITESIFVYEDEKGMIAGNLIAKMLAEGTETLSNEIPENTMQAIRLNYKQNVLNQEDKEESCLSIAMRRFEDEMYKYLDKIDYYNGNCSSCEDEKLRRLKRVKDKYEKYKELFGLIDCKLEITEKIVDKLWKEYEKYNLVWLEIYQKVHIMIRLDDYVERYSTVMHEAGGRIKGYPSTAKDIEKFRFLMSVDVVVAMIALEDYCKYDLSESIITSFIFHKSQIFMMFVEELITEIKLTPKGKERCKAILDIILPAEYQPVEFKQIIK